MSFSLEKCQKNEQGHYLCRNAANKNPVRIVATDYMVDGGAVWLCLETSRPGREFNACYRPADLENIPQRVKRWVNFYRNPVGNNYEWSEVFDSADTARAKADAYGKDSTPVWAIAVPVEFEVRG